MAEHADRIIAARDWLLEHGEHGGVSDITEIQAPPHMIRRICSCGAQHFGLRHG